MINFKTYSSSRSFIFMFEILDECNMWSVDGKRSKETGMFEKHYYDLRLCKKKEGNIMHFSIGPLCTVLAIWSNWTKIKQNNEAEH